MARPEGDRGSRSEAVRDMLNRPINRWWNVVAGSIGAALGAGPIMTYGFGILARSMNAELGWHRDIAANLLAMFLLGSGIGSATLGWLIARYGIRAPATLFALTFGLCFGAVAMSPPVPSLFLLLFLAAGFAGAACNAMPYAVAINGFFDARRGLALGIVVAGSGVGAILFPQIAQLLVTRVGWRAAFAAIGLFSALVASAGLVFLVRTPAGVIAARQAVPSVRREPSIIETCLRSRPFWFIALPILAVSVTTFGAIGSFVFLFADHGIAAGRITMILSASGLAAWLGRLLVGYLLDRVFAPYLTAAVFALTAIGVSLLAIHTSTAVAFIAAPLLALAIGSEADILTFLVSRYFSLKEFSRIVGIIWVVWAWGGGVGTAIVAKSYALLGSYAPAFLLFALVLALAATLVCFIGPYRYPVHTKPGTRDSAPALTEPA